MSPAQSSCEFETEERARLLGLLRDLLLAYPRVRLGQLMSNAAYISGRMSAYALWEATDSELLQGALRLLRARGNAQIPVEPQP